MDLERSRHFRTFTDPLSGVKSYVLDTKVAKAQQGIVVVFLFCFCGISNAFLLIWRRFPAYTVCVIIESWRLAD